MKCDLFVTIPANPDYPVMNLSHAATVIFYELYRRGADEKVKTMASAEEKEKLFTFFDELLGHIDWPEYKRNRANMTFRRLISRAGPTKWEFHTLAGVIRRACENIERSKNQKKTQ